MDSSGNEFLKKRQAETFKKGSVTYFNSSLFFPKKVRQDVFRLYAFLRIADDLVDSSPPKKEEFYRFREDYERALEKFPLENEMISDFVRLSEERGFDPAWASAFLDAMEADLTKARYESLDEVLVYTYGAAEVIGLFMVSILGLDPAATEAARLQGRAMQMINFIRDLGEDLELGRTYLPASETTLKSLSEADAREDPREFVRFVRFQLGRFERWQKEASEGYKYIPKRYLVPIKTASAMYGWTARQIERDPFVVYRKKVKPSKIRVLAHIALNFFTA